MIPDFSRPVVLFGGSFDPVHSGHLHVALAAKRALPGSLVTFVPAALSPGKTTPVAPPGKRLHWLRLAAREAGFAVWDTELNREGPSFTVDTLAEAHLRGSNRERLFLLVGADAYASLPSWKSANRIRGLARVVAVSRPGSDLKVQDSDDLVVPLVPHDASSTAVRAGLGEMPPKLVFLPDVVRLDLENLILLNQNPYARKPQ